MVRHGGRAGTGLTVFIRPPGDGDELRINYERESDCTNPTRLRAQAAADTKGLTRASRINSPKAALAMYEAMCSMADHFEAADQRGQTWEWVQQLQRVAAITTGAPNDYWALRRLQDHDYSKSLVQDPPRDHEGKPQRPIPLLLIDTEDRLLLRHRSSHGGVPALRPRGRGRRLGRPHPHPSERDRRGAGDAREWDSTGRDRVTRCGWCSTGCPSLMGPSERVPACTSSSAVYQRVPDPLRVCARTRA